MAATGYTTGDPNKVNRSGDTMTGTLNLSGGSFDVSDVQEALSTVLSTGVIRGGEMNAADNTSVAISGLTGYIVDTVTDPDNPTVTRVVSNNQTVELTGASLTRSATYWRMTSAGAIVQQGTKPTNTERRTSLYLGATVFDTVAGALIEVQTLPDILSHPLNQFGDLVNALGPFRISGLVVSANGANLSLNHSAGSMFMRAWEHYDGATLTRDPHTLNLPAETAFQFRRVLRAPGASTPPLVTTVDPANYDLNGTLTAVGGGAGNATIQRIWIFGAGDSSDNQLVQYGQTIYSSLSAAVNAVGAGTFVPHPVVDDAILAGYLCVTRVATNLSDPAQAVFVNPGRFSTP